MGPAGIVSPLRLGKTIYLILELSQFSSDNVGIRLIEADRLLAAFHMP
jgi:hypothetical protein